MKDVLDQLRKTSVLVIGDLMVDNYQWGKVERISPEAPVPVVKIQSEELRLGGAANVVSNLAALGCQVGVCGLIGDDAMGVKISAMLDGMGVDRTGLITDPNRPTIEKTRIMAQNQQMLRYDREQTGPPADAVAEQAANYLERHAQSYDGIIVSDYGKGLISKELLGALNSGKSKPPVFVDPKGMNYGLYRGAACLTPNEQEAALASRIAISDDASALEAGRALMNELKLLHLCITRGAGGVLAMTGGEHRFLPARAREVFDVTGAGDTFISVAAALSFSGHPFFECVEMANLAAGVVVGKLGTAAVTPHEILGAAEGGAKYYTALEIVELAASLHAQSKRIVFTNGCFDLIHTGHIQYLQASRALGDVLIIGLNSDASVRRLKGPERPLIGEADRAHLLGALSCVDYVVVFDDDDPLELIRGIRPDLLTKGADYTVETVVGHDMLSEWGGEVRLIPLVEDRSTSRLIEKLAKQSRG
ncbi:MAG: D-glycero-beta-D-manno-heptose 1-phosphate adenylyltransferase [SAR324 cluster bacterium]|nr:D-glycero-beta-D-manno-heptose 1-phosphate adenylyltransferase [SAR324 cluster bacterium]MCZ6533495.1 D-glycero-beta-D-manno-heptose 1-phosphate adenylyltransferase [SAR324 cluster bacterium]